MASVLPGHVIFALDVKTGGLQMQPEDSLTKTLDATDAARHIQKRAFGACTPCECCR